MTMFEENVATLCIMIEDGYTQAELVEDMWGLDEAVAAQEEGRARVPRRDTGLRRELRLEEAHANMQAKELRREAKQLRKRARKLRRFREQL